MIHRSTAVKALTGVAALLVVAACGSSGSSSASSSGSAGAPGPGGNLTSPPSRTRSPWTTRTSSTTSRSGSSSRSIQPLYTVTQQRQGRHAVAGHQLHGLARQEDVHVQLRPGVKFSNGKPMTSADVKFSIDQNRKAAQGWGYLDAAINRSTPRPRDRGHPPQVPVGAAAGRPVALRQRDRAEQLRRRDGERSSTSTRSAPARSSGTTGTRARRSSWCATRTTGRRASRT